MSDVLLNQGTRKRIVVAVACLAVILLGEESNVMTLSTNCYSPLDLF
jgi:hypothetical protein